MNTKQAAAYIGCSLSYLKTLIEVKKVKAKKIKTTTNRHGYVWEVDKESVKTFKALPHTLGLGKPKK